MESQRDALKSLSDTVRLLKGVSKMAANRVYRQRSMGIVGASLIFGAFMFIGFIWLMFEIMGMQGY
jgi:hypothetical protein